MDIKSRKLFKDLILHSEIEVEKGYKQLSEFDHVILAGKENAESTSGFSFLVLQKNELGKTIFRGVSEEFQNASNTFVLRANLNLHIQSDEITAHPNMVEQEI